MSNAEGRTILVDDAPTRVHESAGDAHSMWEHVVGEVRDFTADQPFVALLSAVGLGAMVGFLTTRR